MQKEIGYVYIFSNPEMPDRVKIGKTKRTPEERAEELSRQTSNIGKFKVEWSKKVFNVDFFEAYLHFAFKEFHHEKEFFNVEVDLAVSIAKKSISHFGKLHKIILDEISEKKETMNHKMKINDDRESKEYVLKRIRYLHKISSRLRANNEFSKK